MASLKIISLFPDTLFANGDRGNRLCLQRRLEWRGIGYEEETVEVGEDKSLDDADLILIGGGEEHDAAALAQALQNGLGDQLRKAAEDGVVFFCTGGGFPLLGKSIAQKDGTLVDGLGILPMTTKYKKEKILGNYAFRLVPELGGAEIVGFENHNAAVYLEKGLSPLGRVEKGNGNNGEDGTEGAWAQHLFGTFCQGPILPKHPALCDRILQTALERKYGTFTLDALDDRIEEEARAVMWERVQKGTAERDQ